MTCQRPGAIQAAEHGRVPDLIGRHVQGSEFRGELVRVGDVRQQVGDRDELAVVQSPADETGVAIAPLFAVGHHIDAGPFLGGDGQSNRVVGVVLELFVGEPPLKSLM